MISWDRLHELLHYDQSTGVFTNKITRGKARAGEVAGCVEPDGYRRIMLDRKMYPAHRLAVLYVDGYMPENTVDHRNRSRDNNKYENLREATHQCQMRNRSIGRNNASGVTGVGLNSKSGKWIARIKVSGINKHIGSFCSMMEASCARYAAEQCLGFQDCDTESTAGKFIRERGNNE